MTKLDYAVAQLRHAYKLLISGHVKDSKQFAIGLIGPAIRRIEQYQGATNPLNDIDAMLMWAAAKSRGSSSRPLTSDEQTQT